MTKPPKTPRPPKPPIIPFPGKNKHFSGIGLIHEKLIGRVTIQWALLEASMGGAIIELLHTDFEAGRYVVGRMDATALIKMLRDLGQIRLPEAEFHKLSVLCDRMDMRREDRNLIIHGTWGRLDKCAEPHAMSLRIKSDHPSDVISETFPRDRLLSIIDEIRSLRRELVDLLKLDKSPERPSAQPPEG